MNASHTASLASAHVQPRKSVAAWILSAALAAAAALGMAQNAKADTIWTVAVHEPGIHVALSNAPYPVVAVPQYGAIYPVVTYRHPPQPVVVVPQHRPHGQAHGYWRHHRHHGHHNDQHGRHGYRQAPQHGGHNGGDYVH
jgi:hypothetical protein